MGKLTVAKIRALDTPGLYGDGGTLFLKVAPGGSKAWVQRLTIHGRRRDLGLGGFPLVTLAEAREAAFENRRLAHRGGDPLAAKRRAKIPTFQQAAESTFAANRKGWRSAQHAARWMQSLERYAFPVLGGLPVDRIEREDVLRILTPIWSDKAETARKLRQRLRGVFAWAQAHGFCDVNPAGEAIDGALPKIRRKARNFRALPFAEVPEALPTVEAGSASKWALRFLVLTAARSGEVRGATWSEIDLDARKWRIPAERMKAGVEHRVPLSEAAVAVLESAKILRDGSDLISPSPLRRGRPLSDMTLTKLLRDLGLAERATVHGFRSSFRDWCAETGKPREVAEAALAHTVGGVEGAYFSSDLYARRRDLMDAWARFLTAEAADVVRIHG